MKISHFGDRRSLSFDIILLDLKINIIRSLKNFNLTMFCALMWSDFQKNILIFKDWSHKKIIFEKDEDFEVARLRK